MSKKSVVSVGCEIPGGLSEYLPFRSKASLLDWDVILFNPDFSDYLAGYHQTYQGKPSLGDDRSFRLREAALHWRRELAEAFGAGKTIFVLMTEFSEVYVDTGRREYSGTGRNRQTTSIVEKFNNYAVLPIDITVTASEGKRMKLTRQGESLNAYWKEFGGHSEYKVSISGKIGVPLLETTSGAKTVSSVIQGSENGGALLLLPYLDLGKDEFIEEGDGESESGDSARLLDEYEDDEEYNLAWTNQGIQFGHRFLGALLAIDKALRQSFAMTPPPAWTSDPQYVLPKEAGLREELLRVEKQIEDLSLKKEELKTRRLKEAELRHLLYEKGHPLELAVLQALVLLGFKAERYRDSESEFDAVFEAAEGRLLGEVEGKDNTAVNIDKLRQLQMNIHEDFARDGITEMAKGVLFGNAHRLLPLSDRKEYFTAKCMAAARQSGTALVRTPDLFLVAQHLSSGSDPEFARKCREALLTNEGQVASFPVTPEASPESETRESGD